MNEILKKRIEDFAAEYADSMYKNSTDGERKAAEHDVIKGAEFILCRQWISVEEALPKNHDYVLAGYKDSVFMAWCRRQYDEWHDIYGFELNVDRWMPIPKFETKVI